MVATSTTAGNATSNAIAGGGTAKKKRRKRGGGGGGSKEPLTPQTRNSSKVSSSVNGGKDASVARNSSSQGGARGAKNSKKRRGGRGGGESKRNTSASSPMQLPHVKVTLRNIGDENMHGTVKGMVDSVRIFLHGAFHLSRGTEGTGAVGGNSDDDKFDAYSLACRLEKDQFERDKSMVVDYTSSNENKNRSTSSSSQPISIGWVYEVKETSSQLPSAESLASDVFESKKSSLSNWKGSSALNSIIDAAMSQMMLDCGKKYLDFVGGHVVLEEDSAMDAILAEMVQVAKKKVAENEGREIDASDENKTDDGLDAVTELMSKLDTTNPNTNAGKIEPIPAVKIRILSVTPVKKSKRRGIIGGTVNLALYPPDPCILFKENCRDAGRIAGEKYLTAQELAMEAAAAKSEAGDVEGPVAENKKEADVDSCDSIIETTHTTNTKNDCNKAHPIKKVAVPPIPHFPIITPAERSRAVARSRVLLDRTISAMKIFAQSKQHHFSDTNFQSWDVAESPSQKTWKSRPHPMVASLLNGVPLGKLLADEQWSTDGTTSSRRWRKGYSGDARADRYDSTIESSDDYKAFMVQWSKDGTVHKTDPADESKDKEKETTKPPAAPSSYATIVSKKDEGKTPQPAFDEDGRPLSAIVMHIRAKQEEAAKAKAEAAAAAARARAAAAATVAASKKKKKKSDVAAATSASSSSARKKKREASRAKKSKSKSTSRAGGEIKVMASPPPGAVFLKKGG
ncbi:hypothetical protein ACHAXS_013973 [Conticribra weissflogii]